MTTPLEAVDAALEAEGVVGALPTPCSVEELSWVFLGCLSFRTRVRLFLSSHVASVVAAALSRSWPRPPQPLQDASDAMELASPPLQTDRTELDLASVEPEELAPLVIGALARISELNAVRVASAKTQMWISLLCALQLVRSNDETIEKVNAELAAPPPASPLRWGRVVHEQANAFRFDSSFGGATVQIGSPPETIKVSLLRGEDVPAAFVLPCGLFLRGHNLAEIEFPVFFAAFAAHRQQRRRVIICGTAEQIARIRVVLQESVLGPANPNEHLAEDIMAPGYSVDLRAEMNWIRGDVNSLESLVDLREFDANGAVRLSLERPGVSSAWSSEPSLALGELKIENVDGLLLFHEDNVLRGIADSDFTVMETLPELLSPRSQIPLHTFSSSFSPPSLGITFLGTSHGFDAHGRTTGFILWLGGRGIVIDPPFFTLDYLRESAVLSLIDGIILTHTHSDHDAGVLALLLSGESRMTLFTTRTIHESYKRKTTAILGHDACPSYDFRQVRIGQPLEINGAFFEFEYSLHSVPTIGFRLSFGSAHSISYSSDTHYNPELFSELVKRQIISPAREAALRMRGFDCDVIIHEMGVPPIHTSAAVLNNLPLAIKRKILIVHCAGVPEQVELPDGSINKIVGLRKPLEGLEHTVIVTLEDPAIDGYLRAKRHFQLLSGIPYFEEFRPQQLFALFSGIVPQTYPQGAIVCAAGHQLDGLVVVDNGRLCIDRSGLKSTLFSGDFFGEDALVDSSHILPVTVTALVNTSLLCVPFAFLESIRPGVARVIEFRNIVQQSLKLHSRLFKELSKSQIEVVAMAVTEEKRFRPGEIIINQGDTIDRSMYIIRSGSVSIDWHSRKASISDCLRLGPGECIGEIAFIEGSPRQATVTAVEPTTLLVIKHPVFESITRRCPQIVLSLHDLAERRREDMARIDSLPLW